MDEQPATPTGRRRVLSWLLRGVVLFLVPVVVFSNPQSAQAIAYSDPPVEGTMEYNGGPGEDAVCNVTAYWKVDGTTPSIPWTASCSAGWLNGFDTVKWTVTDAGCRLISPTLDWGDSFDTTLVLDPLLPVYLRSSCIPTTASAYVCDDKWVGETECDTLEFPLALGQPPIDDVVTGSCPYFDVRTPRWDAPTFNTATGNLKGWDSLMRAEVTWKGAGTPTYGNWIWYVITEPVSGGATFPASGSTVGALQWPSYPSGALDDYHGTTDTDGMVYAKEVHVKQIVMGNTLSSGTTTADFTGWFPVSHHTTGGSATVAGNVIGIGVIGDRGVNVGGFDPPTTGRVYGLTEPSKCSFYWGAKVSDVAGTADDPLGAVGAVDETDPDPGPPGGPGSDPDDDSAGCGFSWTDPGTYASAGICKLVGLLGDAVKVLNSILDAMLGLPAAIAGAIADGFAAVMDLLSGVLSDLFVPDPGYFDGKVEEIRTDLDDTQPGHVVEAFDGTTYSVSASGCGGIPVDWSIEGQDFDFDFLAACSGPMASAASIVKIAGSAFLVIFGALGCLRALGAGFGWSPGIGKGGGEA